MQDSLEARGDAVTRLDLSDGTSTGLTDERDFAVLETLLASDAPQFDAVLDINSKLPYLTLDDGEPFLDKLGIPFYNYILDHPLYHHPGLSFPLKNYHAIGIDKRHCEYMERYYPHLKSVIYRPLDGIKALRDIPFEAREIPLLFTGTYLSAEQIEKELLAQGEEMFRLMTDVLSEWTWDARRETLEDVVSRVLDIAADEREDAPLAELSNSPLLSNLPETVQNGTFAVLMNRLYAVDRAKRYEVRYKTIAAVANAGLPLTLMGEGWDETPLADLPNVTLLSPRPMAQTIEVIANSKILLDCNPLFSCGVHDRVSTALANGCVCVSDMNPAAGERLLGNENLLFFEPTEVPIEVLYTYITHYSHKF